MEGVDAPGVKRLGLNWIGFAAFALATLLASRAAALDASTYSYPIKASSNGRYLVDQHNKPFRIHGDSAQSLFVNLTYAEADAYLSDRQAHGFNAVNINLLEHKFAVNAPANRNRDPPFIKPGDFSTPNEAYFAFVDSIIDLAASKGMLVSLAYMYLGHFGGDEGWWATLNNRANTQAVCYKFGLYLGNRYKNRKNILWVVGADFFPPPGSEGEARLHKIMEGVKAAGATQLQTGDWDAPCLSTDEAAFAASMDVNAVYTYGRANSGATYREARAAYSHSPTIPAYLKETGYEAEGWIPGDRASIRKYQYWAILSGCTAGGFYGHRDIWGFVTDSWSPGYPFGRQRWQLSINAPGAVDWQRLGQFLDSLPWYNLVPSGLAGMKTLVTAGGGTFGGSDYVAAAATANGKVLLAYVPPTGRSAREITIDMRAMSGRARARWFNPTDGGYTSIASSLANTHPHQFVTPADNGAGANDWMLVLDVVGAGGCTTDSQCSSGHCADGVCCNTVCDGRCEACDVQGSIGTCAPVGGAPRGIRPACGSDGSACGGACDGLHSSACAYPGGSVSCRAASCLAAAATAAASCGGTGYCPPAVATGCAPYDCGGSTCNLKCADDAQCLQGASCVSGSCTRPPASAQSPVDAAWLLATAVVERVRIRRPRLEARNRLADCRNDVQ